MSIEEQITILAKKYSDNLAVKTTQRMEEMAADNNEHYVLYNVLGVSDDEGSAIDLYQNKGRFLYKYAGSFLEEAAIICLKHAYADAETVKIPNTTGSRPKTFEIDCLVNKQDAFEIKWRDATTDGDHINKEHTRMREVANAGYNPIRLMFFNPLRGQAIKIQKKLELLYSKEGGQYYAGENAWTFIKNYTKIDLLKIINSIAVNES